MKRILSSTALALVIAATSLTAPNASYAGRLGELGRIFTDIHHGIEETGEKTRKEAERAAKKAAREAARVAEQVAHEAERVGRVVDDKLLQPLRTVSEGTAEGIVKLTEGGIEIVTTVSGLDFLHDIIVQGDSVSTALSEAGEDFNKAVRKTLNAPVEIIVKAGEGTAEFTDNIAGEVAGDAVRYVTLATGITASLPSAIVDGILYVSEGGPNGAESDNGTDVYNDIGVDVVDVVVGIPLSAALRQAEVYFKDKGEPLSDQAKALLEPHFGKEVLQTVRVVINDDPTTLPGIINSLQSELGNAKGGNHAVTIGNVIVFDRAPDSLQDIAFIAHEVHHVIQYAEGGLVEFAARYTKNPTAVEQEAHDAAESVMKKLSTLLIALGLRLETT